jgi:hypothetical protein
MTRQHTPKPWVAYFDETYFVLGPDKGRVAICMNLKGAHGLAGRRHGNEVLANARLISAAPDLLEALQSLIDMDVAYKRGAIVEDAVDAARAAIAKATGAQS